MNSERIITVLPMQRRTQKILFSAVFFGAMVGFAIYSLQTPSLVSDEENYEEFFREHVSTTCPITPMPESATSYDPENCQWIIGDIIS